MVCHHHDVARLHIRALGLGYGALMDARKKSLAAGLAALLLLGGTATACGDDAAEDDMGDMEMDDEGE